MTVATAEQRVAGPVRFARFALPPNRRGYCGAGDDGSLEHYLNGHDDPGLRELAAGFEGAYPYLQLLAGSNGRADPLDADVVEAYWIGNELLDRVTPFDFGLSIDERFRRRAGSGWRHVESTIPVGVANHAYHVMHVMPWTGLLRDGIVDEPLAVIDRCRISWATVLDGTGPSPGEVIVRRTPLVWSGSRLEFGVPTTEVVTCPFPVDTGDWVAIHWGWVCERLDRRQVGWLQRVTNQQMESLRAG